VDRIVAALVVGNNFPRHLTDVFLGFAAIGVGRVDAAGLSLSNNHFRFIPPYQFQSSSTGPIVIHPDFACQAKNALSFIFLPSGENDANMASSQFSEDAGGV
jgi:hypothetical protein